MDYVRWEEAYDTGVDVVDYQHKRLLQIVNDLHNETLRDEIRESMLITILDELAHYTDYHFTTEEALLVNYKAQDFPHHKSQHDFFVQKLENYRKEYVEANKGFPEDLLMFLKKWWINHIQLEDKKIFSQIKK